MLTAKVKQQQEQTRFQSGLFYTVLLQKCVATGTKPAFLITYARVILASSEAQCVIVKGGTMKENTFKATRPCGILQATHALMLQHELMSRHATEMCFFFEARM